MKLIEQLQWRYAAKRMNGSVVSEEKISKILEAIRLAPSSMGLQPFQIFIIQDKDLRREIYKKACPQPQVLECSHLLVFSGWTSVTNLQVSQYMDTIARTRDIELELLNDFKASVLKFTDHSSEQVKDWSARQVYLTLGTAIDAAALCHVDATPMEGFNEKALDEVMELRERDLHSVVLLALGYRDEHNDEFANTPKVRRSFEEVFEFI